MLRMGFFKKVSHMKKRTVNSNRWIKISDNLWIRNLKKVRKRAGSARRTDCKWTRKGRRWDGSP